LTLLDSINHDVFLGIFPQFSIFGIQIQKILNRPVTTDKVNPGHGRGADWGKGHRRRGGERFRNEFPASLLVVHTF
jgi:hypothetical protein